ncbi:MAG: peptidylprolyl isomerase [Sedimentisphaerales bacterium]|nr:peptidylprolyl isomerase [Sedimentisphaerales bacterium]
MKIHYTCKLDDGAVVASSREKEPIEFTLGRGQILPGLEEAVRGMETGESKTVRVPPEKAFGPHRKDLIEEVPRGDLPDHIEPQVGQRLTLDRSDGGCVTVTVADVSESTVTLDANHPLASTDLNFELDLLEVS